MSDLTTGSASVVACIGSSGVQQSSVLGRALFSTADLTTLIEQHGIARGWYASIYGSSRPSATHELQQRLWACIGDAHNWVQTNRLQLNTDKTGAAVVCYWPSTASAAAVCLQDWNRCHRRRCVTWESTLTPTSACSLTFSRLTRCLAPSAQHPTISSKVHLPDSGCRPMCRRSWTMAMPAYSIARSPCSTL